MVDTARRKPAITISPMSTAKQVREELCRATGQQVWSDNHYWSYYLANPLPVPRVLCAITALLTCSSYRKAAAKYSIISTTTSPIKIGRTPPSPSWSSRGTSPWPTSAGPGPTIPGCWGATGWSRGRTSCPGCEPSIGSITSPDGSDCEKVLYSCCKEGCC